MHTVHFLKNLLERGQWDLEIATSSSESPMDIYELIDRTLFSEVFHTEQYQGLNPVVIELGAHARSMWTAAVRLSLSGQPYAVPAVARTALESAFYASLIHREPALADAWIDRHKDEKSRGKSRQAFRNVPVRVCKWLDEKDVGLGAVVLAEYERCIDDGAHPNTRGIPRTYKMMYVNGEYQGDYVETADYFSLYSRKTRYGQALTISIGTFICFILGSMIHDFEAMPELFKPITERFRVFAEECEENFPGFSGAL